MAKIDWDKPIRFVDAHASECRFVCSDKGKVVIASGNHYGAHPDTTWLIENVPPDPVTKTIWVWVVKTEFGTQVGWDWTEKNARGYAGTGLLSLKEVTLTEGEGV